MTRRLVPLSWPVLAGAPILTALTVLPAAAGPPARTGRYIQRDSGTSVHVGVRVGDGHSGFRFDYHQGHVNHKPTHHPPGDHSRHGDRHRPVVVHKKHHVAHPREPFCGTPPVVRPTPHVVYKGHHGHHRHHHVSGWDLLAHGDAHRAKSVFAHRAQRYPTSGEPKVGYALACASLHDYPTAVWAMKRAVHYDVHALNRVPVTKGLGKQIDRVLYEIHKHGHKYHVSRADAYFFAAALHVIAHDYKAAHHAIHAASREDPYDPETRSLRHLIDKHHHTHHPYK